MPAGFRRATASGLIVPEEVSRLREVVSRDDWKQLERATKMLQAHGVRIFLACDRPECAAAPLERVRRLDGGITFRCAHRDLEFTKL
jgi:hypothetical protein